jgi:uncharacterized membrane protein
MGIAAEEARGSQICRRSWSVNDIEYQPISWPIYILLLASLALVFGLIQFGILRYVSSRLGLSPKAVLPLFAGSLLGSYVNIPLAHLPNETILVNREIDYFGVRYLAPEIVDWPGTIIAINVGGAVIPIFLSLYLLAKNRIWGAGLIATACVAVICYALARPVPGVGISIPLIIPPLAASLAALAISWRDAAPLAYVSGALGTLIGADLFNLPNIRELGASIASIGGAGTFDGIFLTGIFAVILASLIGRISDRAG